MTQPRKGSWAVKQMVFETTFDRYTSRQMLGQGGSGKVFLVQNESGEQYALKLLDSENVTTQKRKRFANEIGFCQRVDHAHVVRVVGHGVYRAKEGDNPSPFYLMPVYQGSLRGLLDGSIECDKVLHYFAHMLDGVEAAHQFGAIHRDLKPENFLFEKSTDRLIVADFGIAHFTQDNLYTLVETKPGDRLANFLYAAPEQRARGQQATEATDIYALGLMLNEMFTGAIPLGTNYRTIGSVAPDYSYLDEIIVGMLDYDGSKRPRKIEEIKKQLIGRRNNFVALQQLDRTRRRVIPTSELDDPLVDDPPRLVDFDYSFDHSTLTLLLSCPVNELWSRCFTHLSDYAGHSSIRGAEPERFSVRDDRAVVTARYDVIQNVINHVKSWLPSINQNYAETVRLDKKEAEEEQRRQLQQEIDRQEQMIQLRQNITL